MKKVYALIAIATLMVCAASCGNKKKAEEPEQAKTEAPAKEKSDLDELKEAANKAAVDVAKTGINAAAEAAKEATK